MIVICCSDTGVRQRWLESIQGLDSHQVLESASELRDLLAQESPGIVLLDLLLPELNGVPGAQAYCRANPETPFLLLAAQPDEQEGLALIAAGGRGYCNRYISPPLLTKAVEVVRMGEVWLGRKLLTLLVDNLSRLSTLNQSIEQRGSGRLEKLTSREREIAELVGTGASNKVIASRLNVTERTVKAHLSAIFRKTETRDRLQLGLLVNTAPH